MAEKLTPAQKAAEIVETKRLTLAMLATDTEIAQHEATISRRKSLEAMGNRHVASMRDYSSGNALDRAVEGFKVKRAVADLAKSQGLKPNGEAIVVPAPKLDPNVASDVETESASA